MTKINWAISDIDGTLLDYDMEKQLQIIDQETIDALQEFVAKGNELTLASGRNHWDILGVIDRLGLKGKLKYAIGSNGSIVFDIQKSEMIFLNKLSNDNINSVEKMRDHLRKASINYVLSFYDVNGSIYLFEDNNQGEKLKLAFQKFESDFYKHTYIANQKMPNDCQIIKAAFHFISPLDDIEAKGKWFEELIPNTEIYYVNPRVLEVNPCGSSKGAALEKIVNYDKNLKLDKSVSFGDAGNDISMFAVTKEAITLSKARQNVKESATKIIDAAPSKFVAIGIKQY